MRKLSFCMREWHLNQNFKIEKGIGVHNLSEVICNYCCSDVLQMSANAFRIAVVLWCCAMLQLDFEVAFFAFSSVDNDQVKRHLQTRIALGDVTKCQGKYKAGQKGCAKGDPKIWKAK